MIKSPAAFSLSVHIAIRVLRPIIKDWDDGAKWLADLRIQRLSYANKKRIFYWY
jgi:hypothetical protein